MYLSLRMWDINKTNTTRNAWQSLAVSLESGDDNNNASAVYAVILCLSMCLSGTLQHCTKTAKHRIKAVFVKF